VHVHMHMHMRNVYARVTNCMALHRALQLGGDDRGLLGIMYWVEGRTNRKLAAECRTLRYNAPLTVWNVRQLIGVELGSWG